MSKPKDADNRQLIETRLDVSMLVEAGAGSGKTTSMVGRMLSIIASGKSTVKHLAAVTFTRKAAAELNARFQIALEHALNFCDDNETRERYRLALDDLGSLFTGTIHSLCARLLRERPIEAGLDPDFQELEEEENSLLRDICWAEFLDVWQTMDSPILADLADIGIDPASLAPTFRNLADFPDVTPVKTKSEKPDFTCEKLELEHFLKSVSAALPTTVPTQGWDDLQSILRKALRRHGYMASDPDFVQVLSCMDKAGNTTNARWPDKNVATDISTQFATFRKDAVIPALEKWRRYCHYFTMELIVPAVKYFRKVREKSSKLNFQDLLLKAAALLRNNAEVRQYFQSRFTHILVDEFQDTDPVQAEVLLYLTGRNTEERSWREIEVKPGALFVVGDPKQSIYRFRRADIDIYNEVKKIIKRSGGLIVSLTANFRSLPGICNYLNPIFKETFPATATKFQAAFESLDPYTEMPTGGIKRIAIGKVSRDSHRRAAGIDANRIASWIAWAIEGSYSIYDAGDPAGQMERGARPEDFMILLRYRDNLSIYARALESCGIPYEVAGAGEFNESEELSHVLNLLRAVAEPDDQVSMLACLRGPLFGLSDDLLFRFKLGGGKFSYQSPRQCSQEEFRERIEPILAMLSEFHEFTKTKPPGAALNLILDRIGIVPLAATRELGNGRAGNLLKALELALMESAKGCSSFPELVKRLTAFHERIETEGMSIEPGKHNVVRLMNLHKAKGMEAPVVFLADPLKDVPSEPLFHINRMGDTATGYFVAYQNKGKYGKETLGLPQGWRNYRDTEVEYVNAEEKRLLYVAATRAMQLLVVSTYPENSLVGGWKALYPYLENVPELERPAVQEVKRPAREVEPEEFTGALKEIKSRKEAVGTASYELRSVSTYAKDQGMEVPSSEKSGRGLSWGRIIHRMFEALVKEPATDLDGLAKYLLIQEKRDIEEKARVLQTVRDAMLTPLWPRMKSAVRIMAEVPFSLQVVEDGRPVVISGVIDLAFKEMDGWVLADYKTDKVGDNLPELVAYYKPQVQMYRNYWQDISGEEVKEIGLYFVDILKWVPV